jgi:acyl carrier protein
MTEASQAQDSDVTAVVVERFQQYLGTTDELPLESLLLADLGVDSIALVTILLDLAEELGLDLGSADVNLNTLQTLGDVASLVASLRG